MNKLSDKEKRELLDDARSSEIRKDFEKMEKLHRGYIKRTFNADDYIEFLTKINKNFNNIKRPFTKIEGTNFKL
jgi:Mg/Co/Ni transporter MgtE